MSMESIQERLREEMGGSYSRETLADRLLARELSDVKSLAFWRGVAGEFVGCLVLVVFSVGMGLKREGAPDPPLLQGAIGSGFLLAILITNLATISGGHVNPAISVGFLITGHISVVKCIVYIIAQSVGSIAGAGLLKSAVPRTFVGNLGVVAPGQGVTPSEALCVEIIITFFILFPTLSMIDSGRTDMHGFGPFIGGLIVSVNVLFAASISGGCMNPIRSLGPAVVQADYQHVWIYWVGPIIGSVVGSLLYDLLFATHHTGLRKLFKAPPLPFSSL